MGAVQVGRVPVRREFDEAGGDLTRAIVKCPVCDTHLFHVAGTAFEVSIECHRCKTYVLVRRPLRGPIAARYGIRASSSRPETLGSGSPPTS